MTSVPVFKPAVMIVAGLLSLAAGAIGAVGVALQPDAVRGATERLLDADGARTLTISSATAHLWPRPHVVFSDVGIGDGVFGGLSVKRLVARPRLLALLVGRVEINDIALDEARFVLDMRATPKAGASMAESRTRGKIRLARSTVVIRGPADSRIEFGSVAGELGWSGDGVSFAGNALWRDAAVDLRGHLSNIAALWRGERSALRINLDMPAARASFDGTALLVQGTQLDGALTAEGASARALLAWLAREPSLKRGLERFTLKARAQLSSNQIGLDQLTAELDGNRASGALAMRFDGSRPALQGSLAIDSLDATPYVAALSLRDPLGAWQRDPIGLEALSLADIDLRLSAARVLLSPLRFGRVAASLLVRDGRLSLTLGEAQALSGYLRGSVTLTQRQPSLDLRIDATARDVELGRLGGQLFGLQGLEGRTTASLSLQTQGESVVEMVRAATGSLRANTANGAIDGINLEQILRRVERRPLARLGDVRGGRTSFEQMVLNARIAQGSITCEDARLDAPGLRVALAGGASLIDQAWDLRGTVALARATGGQIPPFELPFVVRGAWDSPAVLPDAENLIRRSGAAAPLLDAARARAQGSRDAPATGATPPPGPPGR